ncbi:hypothetical protein [Geodermatophilus sp. SYSU D00079]
MTGQRLRWQGQELEVRTRRQGLRTAATLVRDSVPVGEATGSGRVVLPLPGPEGPAPTVLVLAPAPGVVAQTVLLVPRSPGDAGSAADDAPQQPAEGAAGAPGADDDLPAGARTALDLATAERHRFAPAPGTLAARLRAIEERHPRLWASRHVALAVARVVGALLGLAVLLQGLVQPLVTWLLGLLPRVDLPDLPWPDLDLPSIPWPDVDLPDVSPPGWLGAVLATAEYWGPVLVGVALAVREVRRERRTPRAREDSPAAAGGDGADAHR